MSGETAGIGGIAADCPIVTVEEAELFPGVGSN